MCPPPGARHEIVKVVAAVIGTVEAPPESESCEKLPSGEVSVHEVTPCVFQKIDVRAPSETDGGTAQISAFGSTVGVVVAFFDVVFVVVAAGLVTVIGVTTTGFALSLVCVSWTCTGLVVATGAGAGSAPT